MTEMNNAIDFNSHIPYYIQLIEALKEKIQSGEWQAGDQIPSELDLCQAYGVSRTVVRQSLREIELEGLIKRRKGKGTFVSEPKISESLAQKLTGFYQDMVERGHSIETQVLHQKLVPADNKVADYLRVGPGTIVIDIKRLRFIKGEPIVLVSSYLPLHLCPELAEADITNKSLYEYLENNCGVIIAYGRRSIEAVAANQTEANLLQVEVGAPLILLNSVSYLEDDTPIEYYHAVHRGDRSKLEVELVRIKEVGTFRKTLMPEKIDLPNSN